MVNHSEPFQTIANDEDYVEKRPRIALAPVTSVSGWCSPGESPSVVDASRIKAIKIARELFHQFKSQNFLENFFWIKKVSILF